MKKVIATLLVLFLTVFCITSAASTPVHADPWDVEPIDMPAPIPYDGD